MLAAILMFSAHPLIVAWAEGSASPFLFNAAWRAKLVCGGSLFLILCYWPLLQSKHVLSTVLKFAFPLSKEATASGKRTRRLSSMLVMWAVPITVIGNFDFAVFS